MAPGWAAEVRTVIGDGRPGFGDRQTNNPYGVTIGPDGWLYFCDIDNHVVRRVRADGRQAETVAGSGAVGNSGDGGPATIAMADQPYEVRFDSGGNLYFVDMPNHVVRRVDRRSGRISTVAGNGTAGFSGDGGLATNAQLRQPHSIAFDRQGHLLICDIGNHRVRRVDLKLGRIDTWLGTGARDATPENVPAAGIPFHGPRAIDIDRDGNAYLALREGNAVYRIDAKTTQVTRIAGTGAKGYSGDGGPAREATLNGPKGIAIGDGAIYLADTENHAVRRVDLKSGLITTVLGTGERGDGPDGDPLKCRLNRPHGVFVAKDGAVYVGDSESHRVRVLR